MAISVLDNVCWIARRGCLWWGYTCEDSSGNHSYWLLTAEVKAFHWRSFSWSTSILMSLNKKRKYHVLALKLEQEGSTSLSWKEWKEYFPMWNYREGIKTVAISKIKHISFICKPTSVLQESWKWVLDTIWQFKQSLFSIAAVNRLFITISLETVTFWITWECAHFPSDKRS